MREWQPIETAPKDGTEIDLWMVDQDGDQWREANAYFVRNYLEEYREWDASKRMFVYKGMRRRDGWFAPNHDYDGAAGFCDQPEYFNPHPRQMRTFFVKATHWMPLPEPPK